MTLITFQDGKPVLRDGKVGTGQACCGSCGCGRCVVPPHDIIDGNTVIRIRDSYAEPRWRTQAECERCRMCVEHLLTECDGGCPARSVPSATPLVTLEFSADCGSGAAGTVTVGCGDILSATITNGGSGYATETILEPTLSLSVGGTGTGAVLSINGYTKLGDYWVISGITVVNGGTGYGNNTPVNVVLGTNDEQAPGQVSSINATVPLTFRPPQDVWVLQSGSPAPTGSGLVVSLALTQHPNPGFTPANQYFWVDSWSVVAGGTGYAVGQRIRPLATEGRTSGSDVLRANLQITSVDANGGVTGLDLVGTTTSTRNTSRGLYVGIRSGPITSVSISSFAGFRKRAVSTCPVTVTVAQQAPSAGTGATITATVDSDQASANFGKVTGLTVTNGGSGYVGLCERKTAVGSCDECSPRESPESATCDDTGGCPCGTWVVDDYQEPCECCKWVNPQWGVAFMNLVDGNGEQIQYMDKAVECSALRDKLLGLRSYFEEAGWTVTLDENWCPENVLDVWDTTIWGDGDDIQIPIDPEDPCACGFLFRAECQSCSRAYPAHIWTSHFDIFAGQIEARPFDLSQWVAMPIETWKHNVPTPYLFGFVPLWFGFGGQRVVSCERLHGGVTIYQNPLGGSVPVFNFLKHGFQNILLYGNFGVSGPYHGGALIPWYYSKGEQLTFNAGQEGGVIYIPKCGVEITERARCVRYTGDPIIGTVQVLDDTWATCCAECPPGYRCFFAADPLDATIIEANPLP